MRVLAINDISCVGKCSLSVALPIISACGVTCDVLPTALLSTHTGGFDGYFFHDLTSDVSPIAEHWKKLGITFDIIYSGYLGSIAQIDLVRKIKNDFLKTGGVFVVDPVMGDSGTLYAGFDKPFVSAMKTLCMEADYILPNATEACYLSDIPYPDKHANFPIEQVLGSLKTLCPRPIVTGVRCEEKISVAYINANDEQKILSSHNIDGFFCGAGDVFASAFVGVLARGCSADKAVALATEFTTAAIARSAKEVSDKRYGLNFEKEIFSLIKRLDN